MFYRSYLLVRLPACRASTSSSVQNETLGITWFIVSFGLKPKFWPRPRNTGLVLGLSFDLLVSAPRPKF